MALVPCEQKRLVTNSWKQLQWRRASG